jgi:HEAT repeat protein
MSDAPDNKSTFERITESYIDPMIEILKNVKEASADRVGAAYFLKNAKSEKVVMALCEALSDRDPAVRVQAAYSLGKSHNRQAIHSLLEILKVQQQNAVVCNQAALSLAELYSIDKSLFCKEIDLGDVVINLHDILKSNIPFSHSIVKVLENISDSNSIDNLSKYLKDIDVTRHMVIAAIESIKQISQYSDLQPIIEAIFESSKNISESKPQSNLNFHGSIGQVIAGDQTVTGDNIATQNNPKSVPEY